MSWISSFFFICTLQTLRFPEYCIFLLSIFFSFCPSVSIVYYDQWWGFFYNCFVWLYSVPMCRFNCRPSVNTTCRSIKQRSPFISKYHAIDQLIGTYLVNKFQKMMSHCSNGRTRYDTNSDVTVRFPANTLWQNYCFSMPFLFQVPIVSQVEVLFDFFLSFLPSQVIFKILASLRTLFRVTFI